MVVLKVYWWDFLWDEKKVERKASNSGF